jgi:hypothetical protein
MLKSCVRIAMLALLVTGAVQADGTGADKKSTSLAAPAAATGCLANGEATLRARLAGAIKVELNWSGAKVECSGAARPEGKGLRIRFSNPRAGQPSLALLFGVAEVQEGQPGRALPVNVTIIREGAGEFFSTQGEGKCLIDDLRQVPITAMSLRHRSYRISARGFCTDPARALQGDQVVLLSRFDFVGRVDYETPGESAQQPGSATIDSSPDTTAR